MPKVIVILTLTLVVVFGNTPPSIPGTFNGLIYFPCDFNRWGSSFENFANALRTIWCEHGYLIDDWDYIVGGAPGSAGNVIFDYLFDNCLNTGKHGYITIFTHGALTEESWLAVEYYLTIEEAEWRKNVLEQKYNAAGYIGIGPTPEGDWSVLVSAWFFRDKITTPLPFSLAFIDACHSAAGSPSVAQVFIEGGAESVFGWLDAVGGLQMQAPINIFYRMGGRNFSGGGGLAPVVQSELRNKSAGEARSEYGDPVLTLLGNSNMHFYNSPRIISLEIKQAGKLTYQYDYLGGDYPGDLSGCAKNPAVVGSQPLEVKILFSAPMDPNKITVKIAGEQGNFSIPVNGSWGSYIFDNDLWEGACDFSEWCGSEKAIICVDAEDAFQGDINAKLDINGDGNSDGEDRNHRFRVELPPQVIYTDPTDGEEDVEVRDFIKKRKGGGDEYNFEVVFNKPMDTVSVCQALEMVNVDNDSSSVEIKNIYWYDDRTILLVRCYDTVVVDDTTGLQYNTNYQVKIKGTAKDTSGVTLDAKLEMQYRSACRNCSIACGLL